MQNIDYLNQLNSQNAPQPNAGQQGAFPVQAAVGGGLSLIQGLTTPIQRYDYHPTFNPYTPPSGLDADMAMAYKKAAAAKASKIGTGIGTGIGIALAPFTGGLSIPIGAALGGGVGSLIGSGVAQGRINKEQDEANRTRSVWEQYHNDMMARNNLFNAEQMYKNSLQQNL